jgi:hypothetical protein
MRECEKGEGKGMTIGTSNKWNKKEDKNTKEIRDMKKEIFLRSMFDELCASL